MHLSGIKVDVYSGWISPLTVKFIKYVQLFKDIVYINHVFILMSALSVIRKLVSNVIFVYRQVVGNHCMQQ